MKQRHRVLAWALAGALVLAGVPVRAEGSTVYVSGSGSGENSGMTATSPLGSVYQAQELLPEGGTILVTSTIYIAGEREYSLNDGVTLQAADELEGPLFEIAEGGELTLDNAVLVGNSSTVIVNNGVLKMDDSVSLLVKDGGNVGCVYTEEGAATYLNDELVAGEAVTETEKESETPETEGKETAESSGTEKESETGERQPETDKTSGTEQKQPETAESAETDKKQPETGSGSGTDKKQPETAESAETDKKQPETAESAETEKKQPETAEGAETEKKQPETAETSETDQKKPGTEGKSETEKKQPETAETSETDQGQPETKQPETAEGESGAPETETAAPVRAEAVETVKNAIVALSIHSRDDVRSLLPVSQAYDGLTEAEKEAIPAEVRQLLASAKEMAAAYNHTQLGVSVYGDLPWYVQFQVKMTELGDREEDGQRVLVPYELNLWNLYANAAYTLPEGKSVTVTMPVPDVEIKGEFTVFHYKSDGTVESIKPVIHGDMMSFETSTFSPFTVAGSTVITGIGIGSGTPSGNGGTGSGSEGNPSGTGGTGTGTSSGSGTGSTGTGTSSGSGTQTGTSSGSGTGSAQAGSTSGVTGNYNAVAVNTGDSTNVFPAAVTALAALLIIVGILIHKKKGKH